MTTVKPGRGRRWAGPTTERRSKHGLSKKKRQSSRTNLVQKRSSNHTGIGNQNSSTSHRTSVFVGENFTVSYSQWFIFNKLVKDTCACGVICTTLQTLREAKHMRLSMDAVRLLSVPNAGGSSVISEVLSYELLHTCFGATLLKTEMEVSYFPRGGSITDYVCGLAGVKIGVSVTRAMKYQGNYTQNDACYLLKKKLSGIVQSSRNTLEKWNKQILHVWTRSREDADHVKQAFDTMDSATRSNTLVLVTIATDCDAIFANK
ncbi:AAC-rich mRNA clone AAC4 protein-like [Liolophura sinensis]|uniref:AAC-rich mRNA clone AAC4 protein-like n=1 Tax=Liolophura sinensis TaxID=3198878 RepID=UPI003158BE52